MRFDWQRWKLPALTATWAMLLIVVGILPARQCVRPTVTPAGNHSAHELQHVASPGGEACVVVPYTGFSILFRPDWHMARCATYELTAGETLGELQREQSFATDAQVPGCANANAVAGSGFDRGHLVPAGDLRWDSIAMRESFLMTNVCPQNRALNKGGWSRLEEKLREWARRDTAIIVITGPVVSLPLRRTAGGMVIPNAFFKVVLAHKVRPMRAIAFVYPNEAADGPLVDYAVTVDSVERLSGLRFFMCLPQNERQRLATRCDLDPWLRSQAAR